MKRVCYRKCKHIFFGNKVNTHAGTFKYTLRFLNHFVIRMKKLIVGMRFEKAVKRKDTNVSKHYVVTEMSWGSNPPTKTAYDCESSVLTTMLGRMLLFTARYGIINLF